MTPFARRIPWTLVVFLAAMIVPWLGSRYDTFLDACCTGSPATPGAGLVGTPPLSDRCQLTVTRLLD